MRSDKTLYAYADALQANNLRKADSLHSVVYCNKIHLLPNAPGMHIREAVA